MDLNKPHTAVLNVQAQVHSLLPTGECSGNIVDGETLKTYGINSVFLLSVSGKDADECLTKLKKKLEKFNEHDE